MWDIVDTYTLAIWVAEVEDMLVFLEIARKSVPQLRGAVFFT